MLPRHSFHRASVHASHCTASPLPFACRHTGGVCSAVPVLAAVDQAVLGRVVSTPAQQMQAQQAAEAALMQSSFAYWEHILLHWLWAAVLECAGQLLEACWGAAFWAALLWRTLHGGGGTVWLAAAGKGQSPAGCSEDGTDQ